MILIALLAVPSISLIVYSGIAERREAIANAKAECFRFVNDIAGQQQAIVAGAEQLGAALSLLPAIQSRNPATANRLFFELLKKNPQYANIAICDKSGFVWASAIPLEGNVSVADRRFVREAIRTGVFSSGEYSVGRIAKKAVMNFGYPVKNTANEVVAIIGIVLDLDYSQHIFERLNLPPTSSFSVLDHQGTILIRNLSDPFSQKLMGGPDSQALFTKMTEGPDEGTDEDIENDGRLRLWAYKKIRLPHESKPYIYIRASVPLSAATSKANAAIFRNLSAFVSLFLIGLLLAWFLGKRIIVNPIMVLKGAAVQLAAGADTVNVSYAVKGGELGELAHAFDDMAEALLQREMARKVAGAALRKSEQRLRRFLDSGMVGVIYWSMDGRIIDANDKFLDIFGYSREDLNTGSINWGAMTPPEYRYLDERAIEELRTAGVSSKPFEKEYVRKDGTRVPIIIAAAMFDGPPDEGVAFVLDNTERKRAEEALRLSEEKFVKAFAMNPAAISITGLKDGLIMEVNETWQAKLGYRRDEVIGHSTTSLHLWPTPEDRACYVKELREKGPFRGRELTLLRRSGEAFVVLASAETLVIAGEEVILSTWLDITDRKRMEKELRRSRDELEQRVIERTEALRRQADLIELSHEAIIVRDLESRILHWNRGAEETYGWTKAEAEGNITHFFLKTRFPAPFEEHMAVLTDIGHWEGELIHTRKDGSEVTVLSRQVLQRNEPSAPIAIMEINIDITERKRAEEELRKHRDELESRVHERTEELQKAYDKLVSETKQRQEAEEQLAQERKMETVGTLAGGIAHDFNNMLAVILGNAELALDDMHDGTNGGRHNIEQIVKASTRARDLVRQILMFSRKSERRRKPLKLTPLVRETAKLLRGSLPSTVNIELEMNTASDAILADPSQIQQVLMNLSSNAEHAMREEGGTLFIGLSDVTLGEGNLTADNDMQPGRYVVLTVEDTGTGIPKKIRDRMFDPFFTTKEQGQGTGMGLAVVFGIVKSHEGAIKVESKVGKGSTFRIFLPAYRGAAEEEPSEDASLPTGKERVLVVDDEPFVAEAASETLKLLGYETTTALSGPEGWKKFEDNPYSFDLVITDHVMPDLTGMRLAERMLAVRKDLPVILFTGYTETVSPEKAKAAGIREFLMKPVLKKKLAETVRRVLDSRNRSESVD